MMCVNSARTSCLPESKRLADDYFQTLSEGDCCGEILLKQEIQPEPIRVRDKKANSMTPKPVIIR